jgi:hypothetical protein
MALPTVLIVVAAGLGWMGWRSQVEGTPTAPPLLDNGGWIEVFTSDPDASVSLRISQESNLANETLPGFQWLKINISIMTSRKRPLWWALTLGGEAAFPPGELPVSGTIPSVYSKKDPEYPVGWTYVEEFPNAPPVYYVQQVDFPSEYKDGWGTTIVFGNRPDHPVANAFTIDLATRVRQPFLQDIGEYVTINAPHIGRLGDVHERSPARLYFVRGGVDPKLTAMLKQHRWYEPKRQHAELTAPLVGVRQDSGTPPTAPFQTEWAADDRLKVAASFSRPAETTKNQRTVFFAGVLVSLAASFLVWALELFLGPEREPVAPLQRRPRRSGSVKRRR